MWGNWISPNYPGVRYCVCAARRDIYHKETVLQQICHLTKWLVFRDLLRKPYPLTQISWSTLYLLSSTDDPIWDQVLSNPPAVSLHWSTCPFLLTIWSSCYCPIHCPEEHYSMPWEWTSVDCPCKWLPLLIYMDISLFILFSCHFQRGHKMTHHNWPIKCVLITWVRGGTFDIGGREGELKYHYQYFLWGNIPEPSIYRSR